VFLVLGFAPVAKALVEQAQAAGVELHLVVGGLRTGSGAALEPTTRRYILEHWQAVTEATGQPFKFDGALPDGFVYDTEPACRAIVTARSLAPDCAWTLLGLIQQAFYAEGRDVTQASVLVELAERPACRASSLPPCSIMPTNTPPLRPISPGCRTWALPGSRPCWPSAMANWRC
jgi:protein-disulfide isomerase-like protein with CxxC motif